MEYKIMLGISVFRDNPDNKNRSFMHIQKILLGFSVLFLAAGCEQAKEFKYFVENRTTEGLTVYIDYSISAKGSKKADTLTIAPGDKELVYTHSGLGGFYTGTIEEIRFSGKETLKQEWRNRAQSQANKHFFRRNSWKITYQGDDTEHYLFTVNEKDLEMQ
jgi:hypothetical protein